MDRLKKEVFSGYEVSVNPKTNGSNKTIVDMFLALRRFTFVSNSCECDIVTYLLTYSLHGAESFLSS